MVEFSRRHKLRLRIKSTGHDCELILTLATCTPDDLRTTDLGRSSDTGSITIWTHKLKKVCPNALFQCRAFSDPNVDTGRRLTNPTLSRTAPTRPTSPHTLSLRSLEFKSWTSTVEIFLLTSFHNNSR